MKKLILDALYIAAITSVLTVGSVTLAVAQVAPTPPPMEGGSQIVNDVVTHWGATSTSLQDFLRTVDVMKQDYAHVTSELRQAKATIADLQKQLLESSKTATTPGNPTPSPTPSPSPSAK